eukprot:8593880-Lingulodinium_polyedra.AAC.1
MLFEGTDDRKALELQLEPPFPQNGRVVGSGDHDPIDITQDRRSPGRASLSATAKGPDHLPEWHRRPGLERSGGLH